MLVIIYIYINIYVCFFSFVYDGDDEGASVDGDDVMKWSVWYYSSIIILY